RLGRSPVSPGRRPHRQCLRRPAGRIANATRFIRTHATLWCDTCFVLARNHRPDERSKKNTSMQTSQHDYGPAWLATALAFVWVCGVLATSACGSDEPTSPSAVNSSSLATGGSAGQASTTVGYGGDSGTSGAAGIGGASSGHGTAGIGGMAGSGAFGS